MPVNLSFLCCYILFRSLEALGILCDLELVKDILDGSVHEYRKIVHCVVDAMIGHT